METEGAKHTQNTPDTEQNMINKKPRLLSLDFFRGFTIAAMILVNTPGDYDYVYAPLEHSKWDGCTPTDLVFPFFLFMVGVSIVYALEGKKPVAENHSRIILSALRRMLILIALGLGIFLFYRPDLSHLRFPGVLQRIGVVYFITTLLYLKTSQRTRDWLMGLILVSYYLMLFYIPVPDGHPPNLSPELNLAAWVDRAVFTTNHLYRYTKLWDPVGLLSTWPAIATTLFGIRIGALLKQKDVDVNRKCIKLLLIGLLATILGLIVNLVFPINKSLWSSSYVLYSGGLGTLGLTAAFWIIDVKGYQKLVWPFTVFGINAISAYVLSEIMPGLINFLKISHDGGAVSGMKYFYQVVFLPHFSPVNASLLSACVFVVFIWLIMYILYKREVIIKIADERPRTSFNNATYNEKYS
ncbi:acyltransferase family protein [Mucilaginibacter aquariorum]|uniref:Heparan-alpha-glucosaminide N-acetyltransferase domain-containing protein n=1 Tax=Mucilaginibacter aquariorum TaxID=2967225 RepID=A0ABT1SXV2_9SPHI|nr:heparan-alpha-glucosaminide N-acetyltransferase domain-containing protein [Mucilaginibacter aquariorum]MCQ6957183.1 heparan-alpha-glucosaminide N-acetyltransferase domain-containing protein [Mucilaginibacter aquariorum]